jgi:hypothetical protein
MNVCKKIRLVVLKQKEEAVMRTFIMLVSVLFGAAGVFFSLATSPMLLVMLFGESESLNGMITYVVANGLLASAFGAAIFYLIRFALARSLSFFGAFAEPKMAGR